MNTIAVNAFPNLDIQSVFGGSHEGFNPQVLIKGLQKQLVLPAILLDGPDGTGGKLKMVGQQCDRLTAFGVSEHDAA